MSANHRFSRRNFLALASAAAAGCATGKREGTAMPGVGPVARRPGPNEIVRIGLVGCGARGMELLCDLLDRSQAGQAVQVAAVCDIYEPRKQQVKARSNADLHHHWEDLVERNDIDAVVIATPDHWHAAMAIAAMETGKDVYCETPMAHHIEEAKAFRDCAVRTGRVVQIGAQQVSQGRWHAARQAVRAGVIGKVRWSQGSFSSNGAAEWSRPIDANVNTDTLDWHTFLGNAPQQPFSPERFFGWRKYWDFSGGIATDVHYLKLAPLLMALGPEFPERVSAAGGIYVRDDREAPDSFVMNAEYPSGHTIVLASSMANTKDRPAVIRGQEASLEFRDGAVTVKREPGVETTLPCESRPDHVDNWLHCVRSREKCVCGEDLGYCTMVAIGMSIEAYRQGKTLSFDVEKDEVIPAPPRILPEWDDEQT